MLSASVNSIFSIEELTRVANQMRNRFDIMRPEERRMVLKVISEKICVVCCESVQYCTCDGGPGFRYGKVACLSAAAARRRGRPLSEKQQKLLRIVREAGVRGIPAKAVAEKMGVSPETAASSLSRFVKSEVLETVKRVVKYPGEKQKGPSERLVKFYRVPAGKEEVL